MRRYTTNTVEWDAYILPSDFKPEYWIRLWGKYGTYIKNVRTDEMIYLRLKDTTAFNIDTVALVMYLVDRAGSNFSLDVILSQKNKVTIGGTCEGKLVSFSLTLDEDNLDDLAAVRNSL